MLTSLLLLLGFGFAALRAPSRPPSSDHVLIVTLDGVRWQEVFGGAARELIATEAGGVRDTLALLRRFWRESREARRAALMPFLWGTLARDGKLLGDSASGSVVRVTNGKWFSYPGYNELFTGAADEGIDSNDKIPNPNVSVLEWLNHRPGFHGSVAAFGSWDVLPFIFDTARSHLPANGDGPPVLNPRSEAEQVMNHLAASLPPYWGNVRFDAVTAEGALHYLKLRKPRVLYVMLGDTDEWAHERRYDLYLDAVNRGDRLLKALWETAQAMPEYRGRTTLLVATDHGRGSAADWTDHGKQVPAAGRIWVAGLGPGVNSGKGQQSTVNGKNLTQAQFAATIAAALGLAVEFRKAYPKAAPAIAWR
ncbi:MAG TPA: hypothetical protein VGP61_00060 [Gemmatimonadales bacterium]|jgi:hypothetical protein|nr:hypothetical protein [Gemmatimonadales bacterium]